MLPRSLHYGPYIFSFGCLFNFGKTIQHNRQSRLDLCKPLTTEITENKTTPKFCKITVSVDISCTQACTSSSVLQVLVSCPSIYLWLFGEIFCVASLSNSFIDQTKRDKYCICTNFRCVKISVASDHRTFGLV